MKLFKVNNQSSNLPSTVINLIILYFFKFTEIAVNPDNPNIKGKKVLIATWNNFIRFHGKNWNIMVVHHDKPKKELFKYRFDANFKIWVSSEDMVVSWLILNNYFLAFHPISAGVKFLFWWSHKQWRIINTHVIPL